jgi:hypothetical protein
MISEQMKRRLTHLADQVITLGVHPRALISYKKMRAHNLGVGSYVCVSLQPASIYLSIPKCGSSQVRSLFVPSNTRITDLDALHDRLLSGIRAPADVGLRTYDKLKHDPQCFKFTFVRNPYDRLVSCYADKFAGRTIGSGWYYTDLYRDWARRAGVHADPNALLGFDEFVRFVYESRTEEPDPHLTAQVRYIDMMGADFEFDFIGRIERGDADFAYVCEQLTGQQPTRGKTLNRSDRQKTADYYTAETAALVAQAYECDFDRLHYSKQLS